MTSKLRISGRVKVDRNPNLQSFAGAAQADEEVGAQIRAQRAARHKRHLAEKSEAQRDAENARLERERQDAPKPPVREDVESLEVTLNDGRVVVLAPPAGVSLTMNILTFFEGREGWSVADERVTRMLMSVRSIDGLPVLPIRNLIDRQDLGNRLGDLALHALLLHYNRTWPPLQVSELPTVKKNLRGA